MADDQVLQSPTNPHFIQPLLPTFNSHLSIPVKFFSKYLHGRNENKKAKLRSDASDTTWEVELEDCGRRFTGGWKEFVTAHRFQLGDVIVFRHEGDLVFHVTAFGPSCCEIDYTKPHYIDDDDDDQDKIETKPEKKRAKKNQWRQEESSDSSCFVANVSHWSIYNDRLYVPKSFVLSNGLRKKYRKVDLLNEKGSSWKLSLDHDESGDHTYLRLGWKSFCKDNGMSPGRYTFKLIRNSGTGTVVIRLCEAEHRPEAAETWFDDSCFAGSVSPSSLRNDRLYLPREFARTNGLNNERCEVVLKNEHGRKWNLVLRHNKTANITVIRGGWRRFCEAIGLKARHRFTFKLVKTGENPVLRLCREETRASTVDSSEGNDVNSLSTDSSSGEESGDESSVKEESIEVKRKRKRKYCSRQGASCSPSQYRFVTLCMTPSSVKTNRLRLPIRFTRANGIKKPGMIMLSGQDGVTWMVHVLKDDKCGRMRLGRGWIGFCEANGVKTGESFTLELVREKDATPVLKFSTKIKDCV